MQAEKLSSEQHTNHSCRESLTTMKSFVIISLLALLFVEEATSTHLETCNCNEIRSIVNESIEDAVAKLENKLLLKLNSAITNKTLQDTESSLTSTMERLLKPIQEQLNYHLPPPPSTSPAPPPSTQAPTQAPNSEENPAKSCKDLYSNVPDAVSGYYWIKTSLGSPARVYCKMDADCQNMTGGWMRIAYIDMRNSSHQCPSGLSLTTRSSEPRRVCDYRTSRRGCGSKNFTAHGISYGHVYGRIKAYQDGNIYAFRYTSYHSIDKAYMYGVSLTHGQNLRKHIWTFAGASDESTGNQDNYKCPCINSNLSPSSIAIPSFIGNDYFCDTALANHYQTYTYGIHPSDPLWDGEGCGANNTCCSVPNLCGNNSPPWFIKHLPSSTTDDVEMRLCHPDDSGSTPIEIVELYVQ